MLYSLDRIEEDVAVLVDEAGDSKTMPKETLPVGCRIGAMLREVDGVLVVDEQATTQRRERVIQLQNSVCKRRRR